MDVKIMAIEENLHVIEYYFPESLSQLRIGTYPTILFGQLAEHKYKKTCEISVGSHLITCMNAICLVFFCCQAKQDRDNTSTLLGATICIFKKPATIDSYYETTKA